MSLVYFDEYRTSGQTARGVRQSNPAPDLPGPGSGRRGGLPVGRLQERIGIAASTLSHHLHRLILTGLVQQERQATTLICRANYRAMDSLLGFLTEECCADAPPARSDGAAA